MGKRWRKEPRLGYNIQLARVINFSSFIYLSTLNLLIKKAYSKLFLLFSIFLLVTKMEVIFWTICLYFFSSWILWADPFLEERKNLWCQNYLEDFLMAKLLGRFITNEERAFKFALIFFQPWKNLGTVYTNHYYVKP